jgi:hypothetical protein
MTVKNVRRTDSNDIKADYMTIFIDLVDVVCWWNMFHRRQPPAAVRKFALGDTS